MNSRLNWRRRKNCIELRKSKDSGSKRKISTCGTKWEKMAGKVL
jgi:hypothetical protein